MRIGLWLLFLGKSEAEFIFQSGNFPSLAGLDEGDGDALFARPRRPPAAVGVVFRLLGKLVVDDEGERLHIDATGGYIGGDEELDLRVFKGPHHFIALLLGKIAMDHIHREFSHCELLGKDDGPGTSAAKNDATLFLLFFEKLRDEVRFVIARADDEAVVDVPVHDVGFINLEQMRLGRHVILDEALDGIRDGGREEPSAAAATGEGEDFDQLLFKSHAEHFIRFIEDQVLDGDQGESLAVEKVHQPAGGGDDDVGWPLEGSDLAINVFTAADSFSEDFIGMLGEAEQLFGNLLGQLAGGGEDQRLDLVDGGIDFT